MRIFLIAALFTVFAAVAGAKPTTLPATTAAATDPPAATPLDALRSLNLALRDGDAAALRSLFLTVDDDEKRLIGAMADYAAALVALHKAAEKSYGPDGANLVTGDIGAQSADGLAAIERAEVQISGDKASVNYAGAKDAPVQLVKVDGRWKLPLAQLLDGADKAAEIRRLNELTHQAHLAKVMARELAAGKYKEGASRAAAVWRSRLLEPISTQPTTRP